MENVLSYHFDPTDEYVFLRDVLNHHWKLSHSLQNKLKAQSRIKVNGIVSLTNYRLCPDDLVTVDLSLQESSLIAPIYHPLEIIHEDTDCLVINKPAGMAVHSQRGGPEITLANAVTFHWAQQGLERVFRPVNRLDKYTSGLVLIAQSHFAHQALFRQQESGLIKRQYLALVEGVILADEGKIDLPIIQPDPDLRPRAIDPTGKPALTCFQVKRRFAAHTLLSLKLGTGRTHQIRVHLSHIGHPISGDSLYGSPSDYIDRQALHASNLSFFEPRNEKELIKLEAVVPTDILLALEKITRCRL